MNILRRVQHRIVTKILTVVNITDEIEMHLSQLDNAFHTVYPGMDPKIHKRHLERDLGEYYLKVHGVPLDYRHHFWEKKPPSV
jgi:hypothetical protein